jgi:hypothetical protein
MSDVNVADVATTQDEIETSVSDPMDVLELTMNVLRQHAALVKAYGEFHQVIVTLPAKEVKMMANEVVNQLNRHCDKYVSVTMVGDEYKFVFYH